MMRFLLTICLLTLLNDTSHADDPKTPKRLLFIGNSLTYTNDLPGMVQEMFVAIKHPKPVVESITVGGASLGDHWQMPGIRELITGKKWDYIILQQGPSSLAESQKEFMRDMETAKPWLKQSGAKPALYMVWPDATRSRFFPQVRQAYANAAKSVDGLFLPAGLAFQHIIENEKGIKLYTDGLHPTELGTYLAAMVITSKLTGAKPDQFPQQITWAGQLKLHLSNEQHQACIRAANTALKDEGK